MTDIEQDYIAGRQQSWGKDAPVYVCPYCGHRLWAEYLQDRRYAVKCDGCNDTHAYTGRWDERRIQYVTADGHDDAIKKCGYAQVILPATYLLALTTAENYKDADWRIKKEEK